jgi:flagellar secretion chaperone FliS
MSYPDPSAQSYLEATVRTAPPARLRLMLIERGVGLCQSISARWKSAPPATGCDEQTLHLSDILTELLSGVGRSDLPVAKQVADLYVFLIQHLAKAEAASDRSMIDEIGVVLEAEAETWRAVCATTCAHAPQSSVAAPAASRVAAMQAAVSPLQATDRAALAGSLNLQG